MPDYTMKFVLTDEGAADRPAGGSITSASAGPSASKFAADPVMAAFRKAEDENMAMHRGLLARLGAGGGAGGALGRGGMLGNLAGTLGLPNPMAMGGIGRAAAVLGPAGALLAGGMLANHMTSGLAEKHAASGFSADLTGASAQRGITQMRTEFREAQALGPALARHMEAQTKIQEMLAEMLLPIKRFIVEVMAGLMGDIAGALRDIRAMLVKWGWIADKPPVIGIENLIDEFLGIEIPGMNQAPVAAGAAGKPNALQQIPQLLPGRAGGFLQGLQQAPLGVLGFLPRL